MFFDPQFGSAVFFTAGGASSCDHEIGTGLTSEPSLQSTYIGPDPLPHDQPAPFDVVVANKLDFWNNRIDGPGGRPYVPKNSAQGQAAPRPFWTLNERWGFAGPDLTIRVQLQTLAAGLRVQYAGGILNQITFQESSAGLVGQTFSKTTRFIWCCMQ